MNQVIGYLGENGTRDVHIPVEHLLAEWPDLTPNIWMTPVGAGDDEAYQVESDLQDGTLVWHVSDIDTVKAGTTKAVVRMADTDGRVAFDEPFMVTISPTLSIGGEMPVVIQPWVDKLSAALEESIDATEKANEAASAAGSAANRANDAANGWESSTEKAFGDRLDAIESAVELVPEVNGAVITVNDAASRPLRGLTIYGKSTQNGTPTPTAPVDIVTAGTESTIVASVGTTANDENAKVITIATPNGLPGIPVTSDGNYTDATGQQWVCDEVDLERGVRIVRTAVRTDITQWIKRSIASGTAGARFSVADSRVAAANTAQRKHLICTHFPIDKTSSYGVEGTFIVMDEVGQISARVEQDMTVDDFKALVTGAVIVFRIAEPYEEALSAAELAAYRALTTNYPSTTIYNDGGADMTVRYVADTQLYINNRISAMAAAMAALEEGIASV